MHLALALMREAPTTSPRERADAGSAAAQPASASAYGQEFSRSVMPSLAKPSLMGSTASVAQ